MANKIIIKKSSVAGKVPAAGDLEIGELAVNLTDQKLYSKNSSGSVIQLGGGSGSGDVIGPVSATDNALARFDGTTGKLIQNGTVTQDDNGNLANVNSVAFDTTPTTPPTTTGTMYWDSGNQTPSINLNADTTLQVGQESVALVYNGTGSTIANGSVVAVAGAQGQRPSVVLADADSESYSASTLGIATQGIANGAEGFVTTFGFVRGLDTSAFTAGQAIWLSQTSGQFTATRPSAPAHSVFLGWVIKVNASAGEVFVNISNGWELDELHNVLITSPASGNTLIYDATAGVWKNANLTDGTGITITEGAGSITIANAGVTSLTGTTNEIDVSASTGAVTLSLPATINADTTGNAATATSAGKWTTARTLSFTGDATGSGSVDGSANVATALTLANTTVTAGSYTNTALTVDAKGRITAASSGTAPVTSVTASGALASSGGTTPAITHSTADGFLHVPATGTTNNGKVLTAGATAGSLSWTTPTTGTVTSVTGTAPISSSGGNTPAISISQASSTTNGYLSSTDWNTFNNKGSGTVTSVTGTSPVASSGGATPTISLSAGYGDTQNPYASKTANYVLAAPNGIAGSPTFRSIVAADIPTLNQNTTGTAGNVTGTVAIANGGTGATTATAALSNLGAYPSSNPSGYTSNTGTVTNVTGTAPVSVATGTTTPVISMAAASSTTNGYLTSTDWNTFNNKTSNTGTVTSVGMTTPTGLTVTGSPVTTSGTLALTMTAGYAIPTTASQTNWDSAYTQRLQWDGSSTNLVAATGRSSLGGSTVGQNFFTLTNPTAITFPRINADNTVSALDAATFRTAIGAGTSSTTGTVTNVTGTAPVSVATGTTTPVISMAAANSTTNGYLTSTDWTTFNNKGSGTVTSVGGTGSINGITLSGTVTSSGNLTLGGTLSNVSLTSQVSGTLPIANGGTGQTTASAAFNSLSPITTSGDLIVGNGTNSATRLAIGTNGYVLTSDGTTATWAAASGGVANVQTFSTSGTWTKPSGVNWVYVEIWGAGGGGGSGAAAYASTAVLIGGTGGSGGSFSGLLLKASDLSSTVSVTIGSGGTGGAARVCNNPGNGYDGTDGGITSFGSYISAFGGRAGSGGNVGTYTQYQASMVQGAQGGISTSATSNTTGSGNAISGSGGGAGGGVSSSAGQVGTAGGTRGVISGGGGTANGGTGGDYQGGGGGNGSALSFQNGVTGGNGGLISGGGGGGACGVANSSRYSGAGGNGGNGYAIIYSW